MPSTLLVEDSNASKEIFRVETERSGSTLHEDVWQPIQHVKVRGLPAGLLDIILPNMRRPSPFSKETANNGDVHDG